MKYQPYTHHSARCVLLFAGWSMDGRPFRQLAEALKGYDLVVAYDYTEPDAPAELLSQLSSYEEIVVAAWSFGVAPAAAFISANPGLPVTARIAVNGTMHPVNDERGIPRDIFEGTLAGLDERNLERFYRRMAASDRALLGWFNDNRPNRTLESVKEELNTFKTLKVSPVTWDLAIIADKDLVIPTANQQRAWESDAVSVKRVGGAHLLPLATLLPPLLRDKSLIERRFHAAREHYASNAPIQRHIVGELLSRLPEKGLGEGARVLDIGGALGESPRMLQARTGAREVEVWDIIDAPGCEKCDAEVRIKNSAADVYDVILCASTMQWFNSPREFLRHVARVLKPGGVAVLSTFGDKTMREIHASYPNLPSIFPTLAEVERMLPAGMRCAADEALETIEFDTPAEVLRHVKSTGVNALTAASSVASTRRLLQEYPLSGGKACITYHPIYITIRK